MPLVGSSSRTTALRAVPREHHLQGEPLALAAGQVSRVRILPSREPGGGHAGDTGVLDGVPVHEVVAGVLEQQRDLPRPLDAPARGLVEPLGEAKQRALPGAVAAHERDALARVELQRDAAQDRGAVLDLVPQVLDSERWFGPATVTTQ